MKIIIQRVLNASVSINNITISKIDKGLLVFLGVENEDTISDLEWLVNKIIHLRIFNDSKGVMNLSLNSVNADVLVISQFTLMASTKKGNRPSYIKAAKPDISIPLYEKFIQKLEKELKKKIESGVFGADMKISLINDGPVTIIIDSKNKE